MPRAARLDGPGVLHHVMIRGIERRKIFRNDKDPEDFIERLEVLCPETHNWFDEISTSLKNYNDLGIVTK